MIDLSTSPFDALPRNAVDALMMCDSYDRPRVLLQQMIREPDRRIRLELFLNFWNMCDAPWLYRSVFAQELRHILTRIPLKECLPDDELDWFISLPSEIAVFRGCERGRERGLAWTTDLKVALGFAQGKRCRNRLPTLMTAVIPKEHVFGVFLDRKESEIVVDPRRLRRLRPHPDYVAPQVPRAAKEPAPAAAV
jgi:hypothetical protein